MNGFFCVNVKRKLIFGSLVAAGGLSKTAKLYNLQFETF